MHILRFASVFVVAACVDPPPHVILEVRDDNALAGGAQTLALGRDRGGEFNTIDLDGRAFPVTLTVDGFEAGEVILMWVDAKRGDEVLASGRVRLEFPDGESGNASVTLAIPCDSNQSNVGCALPDGSDAELGGGNGVCIEGRCATSRCGDGVVDSQIDSSTGLPRETCDDGNENTEDACPDGPSGTCQTARCGDGFLHNGVEPCDDGNNIDEDRCRSEGSGDARHCVLNLCGDGFINRALDEFGHAIEECDDGNTLNEDACRIVTEGETTRCVANVCGDGIVDRSVEPETGLPREDCDDVNDNPNDACNACQRPRWTARIVLDEGDNAGLATLQNGDPATLTLDLIGGLVAGPGGELYIADQDANQIWKFSSDENRVTRIAGTGIETGFPLQADTEFGDGGDALRSTIRPRGLATDGRFLYFANSTNQSPSSFNATALHGVFRMNLQTRRLDLIAGRPQAAFSPDLGNFAGDGGPARAALLHTPSDVAVSTEGVLFIADTRNYRVRMVVGDTIYTAAGTGTCAAIGAAELEARSADLCWVRGLAFGPDGRLYLSDEEPPNPDESSTDACDDGQRDTAAGDRVWALSGTTADLMAGTGRLELVAGTGFDAGCDGAIGDGGPAGQASLSAPYGLTFDTEGNLYIGDLDHHRVRRVNLDFGEIETIAGTGNRGRDIGADARSSELDRPRAVTVNGSTLYVGEIDERLLAVDLDANTIRLLTGLPSNATLTGLDSRALLLKRPLGLDFDSSGALYLAEQTYGRILRIASLDGDYPPTRTEVFAGMGGFSVFVQGFGGDGGAALSAQFNQPHDVAVFEVESGQPIIFVADTANHRIRRISSTGVVTTVAGTGAGEDPFLVGELRIVPTLDVPIPTTAAGDFDPTDEGQPAVAARLNLPTHVIAVPSVTDPNVPEIYFVDFGNQRIRKIDAQGNLSTVAGDGTAVYTGSTGESIGRVGGLAYAAGRIYFVSQTDESGPRNSLWRIVSDASVSEIRTFAIRSGSRLNGLAASTATGTLELFVAVDDDQDDADEYVLRVLPGGNDGATTVELFAGFLQPTAFPEPPQVTVEGVQATASRLFSPTYLATDALGNVVISDPTRLRVRGIERTSGTIDTVVGRAFPGDGDGRTARLGAPIALLYEGDNRWWVGDDLGQPVLFPNVATLRSITLGATAESTKLETLVGQNNGYDLQYFAVSTGQRELPASSHNALRQIGGLASDPVDRSIYITDPETHRLYRLRRPTAESSNWSIELFTGFSVAQVNPQLSGSASGLLDDATFKSPTGLALDEDNRMLYVADTGNHTVRVIDLDLGTVSNALAGIVGIQGFSGDDVPNGLSEARFDRPSHLALACDGSLYVSDTGNRRVRRIDFESRTVTTVLGTGLDDNSGQFAPANTLSVAEPGQLSVDRFGNLYVASRDTVRVVSATVESSSCPPGTRIATGQGEAYSAVQTSSQDTDPEDTASCLRAVATDPNRDNRFFAADACQGLLIELTR